MSPQPAGTKFSQAGGRRHGVWRGGVPVLQRTLEDGHRGRGAALGGRRPPGRAGSARPRQARKRLPRAAPLPQRPRTPEGVLGPRRPAIPGACPCPPRRLQYAFFFFSATAATSLSLRQRVANRYFYRRAFAAVASAFRHAASCNSQAHIHFGF